MTKRRDSDRRPQSTIAFVLGACTAGTPVAAQIVERGPGYFDAPTFVFARYATESASSLYAVNGLGRVGAFVAMVHNPQTAYAELIGGVFTRANWGRQNALFAMSYAYASDAEYLQTYLMPEVVAGRLVFAGTMEWYEPLSDSGTRQLDVNPVSLVVRVASRLNLGAGYTLGIAQGSAMKQRAGPVVEYVTPLGVARVELLGRLDRRLFEFRAAMLVSN